MTNYQIPLARSKLAFDTLLFICIPILLKVEDLTTLARPLRVVINAAVGLPPSPSKHIGLRP